MELGLAGKTALVTGGSVGIGKAIAARLAAEGCDVVICARGEDRLREAAEELADREGSVHPVVADVTDDEDVDRLEAEAHREFGGVDVLVNNVGTLGSEKPFHEIPDDEWRHVFETNVMSAVKVTRAVLPHMREQEWGRIVNVASEAGSQPDAFKTHYDATKAALVNITKNLSKAYGDDCVLVNAVSPATTVTPLVEELFEERAAETGLDVAEVERQFLEDERPEIVVGRLGEPDDVANVVAFLASEAASFVTGANYRVDGGSISTMDA
jgi:NAD(P)-dependent dehydrogenase (short-subunit alcohol dehydrogenase family)